MLETDLKINEIARRVGYDDLYYFSYLFKRREGITPPEFIANCFKIDYWDSREDLTVEMLRSQSPP